MDFGEYTLLDKIGTGDMGTCYKATHSSNPDQIVVVKVLDQVDTSNVMKRGSAMDILEFVLTLHHPKLHPLITALETDDARIGLVMPLAAKGSLADVLASGTRIPPKDCLQIIAQVASAVQFLHDQEVAHGSIKPSNILLDAEGKATLTDLSMAHLRELGFVPDDISEQHHYYMSPQKEFHAPPDTASDVFSLAVLTYRLLANHLPFDDPIPEARSPIPTGGLPPAMAAVLRKSMAPQPRQRYGDLKEFMEAVKDATKGKVDPLTHKLFGFEPEPEPEEDAEDQ